jgi:hypothetical protein
VVSWCAPSQEVEVLKGVHDPVSRLADESAGSQSNAVASRRRNPGTTRTLSEELRRVCSNTERDQREWYGDC